MLTKCFVLCDMTTDVSLLVVRVVDLALGLGPTVPGRRRVAASRRRVAVAVGGDVLEPAVRRRQRDARVVVRVDRLAEVNRVLELLSKHLQKSPNIRVQSSGRQKKMRLKALI